MIYDPNDATNINPLDDPFTDGVTVRGSVEVPVTLGGLPGHQGITLLYSTNPGTDFEQRGTFVPPFPPGTPDLKNRRYYFSYSFDQQIYQSATRQRSTGLPWAESAAPAWCRAARRTTSDLAFSTPRSVQA
jgi:hypothetical protein